MGKRIGKPIRKAKGPLEFISLSIDRPIKHVTLIVEGDSGISTTPLFYSSPIWELNAVMSLNLKIVFTTLI
jgi:hypothetical protein